MRLPFLRHPRHDFPATFEQRNLVDGFEVALRGVLAVSAVSARGKSDFCKSLIEKGLIIFYIFESGCHHIRRSAQLAPLLHDAERLRKGRLQLLDFLLFE